MSRLVYHFMQTVQFNIRLEPDHASLVRALAGSTGLMASAVVNVLLCAALRAVKENGMTFPLPLSLTIVPAVGKKGAGAPK